MTFVELSLSYISQKGPWTESTSNICFYFHFFDRIVFNHRYFFYTFPDLGSAFGKRELSGSWAQVQLGNKNAQGPDGSGINLLWMPIRWRKDLRVFLPGNLSSKYIKMIRWKVLDLPERTALESFSQERSSLVDFSPRKVGMSTGNSDHRTLPPKANTQSAILEDATVDPHQSEVSGYPKGKGVSFRNIATTMPAVYTTVTYQHTYIRHWTLHTHINYIRYVRLRYVPLRSFPLRTYTHRTHKHRYIQTYIQRKNKHGHIYRYK